MGRSGVTQNLGQSKRIRFTTPQEYNGANKLDSPRNKIPLGNMGGTSGNCPVVQVPKLSLVHCGSYLLNVPLWTKSMNMALEKYQNILFSIGYRPLLSRIQLSKSCLILFFSKGHVNLGNVPPHHPPFKLPYL